MSLKLYLKTQGFEPSVVALHEERLALTSGEVLGVSASVLEDRPYSFLLDEGGEQSLLTSDLRVSLAVNGKVSATRVVCESEGQLEVIPTQLSPNHVSRDCRAPFAGIFGFAQIEVVLQYADGAERSYFSDFLQVLLPESEETSNLTAMAEYIVRHRDVLKVDGTHAGAGLRRPDAKEGLDRKDEFSVLCDQLEAVADSYAQYMGYFQAHARTKLETVRQRDSFEKLKSFDGQTLQYILQHPSEFRAVGYATGIALGGRNVLPRHTLVTSHNSSRSTYENDVIVGFLPLVLKAVKELNWRLKSDFFAKLEMPAVAGYVSSVDVVMASVADRFTELARRLNALDARLRQLYDGYSQVLPVPAQPLIGRPKPTQVFMRVPVYRHFYDLIVKWFDLPKVDFSKEEMLFSFLVNSRLYEYFVLVTEIEQIKSADFALSSKYRFDWADTDKMAFYEDSPYANTFVFEKDAHTVTLYYQPVVYDGSNADYKKINDNGMSLRRITQLTFAPRERGGYYYLPDFVVKIDDGESAEYVIADAKYATLESVNRNYASELAFKYLLSVRAVKPNECLKGLQIYYGITSEEGSVSKNYFDRIGPTQALDPFFKVEARLPPTAS